MKCSEKSSERTRKKTRAPSKILTHTAEERWILYIFCYILQSEEERVLQTKAKNHLTLTHILHSCFNTYTILFYIDNICYYQYLVVHSFIIPPLVTKASSSSSPSSSSRLPLLPSFRWKRSSFSFR